MLVGLGHLHRRGRALHVHDVAVRRREHVVVRGRAIVTQRRAHHRVERRVAEHRAHLELARDADPLVVRRQLVAGERQPGRVPSHADPDAVADREDRRVAGNAPLDRDEFVAVARGEVVVVADQHVAVGGRGRCGHHVAAPAVDRRAAARRPRLVPDLLDRAREQRQRVDVGAFRGSVQLLDQPRHRLGGERPGTSRRARAARRASVPPAARRRTPPPARSRRRTPRRSAGRRRGTSPRSGGTGSCAASRSRVAMAQPVVIGGGGGIGGMPAPATPAPGASAVGRPAARAAMTSAPRPQTVAASHTRPARTGINASPRRIPQPGEEREHRLLRTRDQSPARARTHPPCSRANRGGRGPAARPRRTGSPTGRRSR